MGRNMTDVSGIDSTQGALARWIAANANTMSTVPGAGPGLLQGAWNWLTGIFSITLFSCQFQDDSQRLTEATGNVISIDGILESSEGSIVLRQNSKQ
jgi:hypothetical protein